MRKNNTRLFIANLIAGLGLFVTAQAQNHFVLSVDPTIVSISQGSTASFTVTLAMDDRTPFDFSFAGLPQGVIAESRRGHSGANTIILTALPSATTGKFNVDVIASASGGSQRQTFTLHVKARPPIQWEYHAEVASSTANLAAVSNTLGEDGWELVSVVLHGDNTGSPELIAFFKRPK
jgi:uncharacterized membrane protein